MEGNKTIDRVNSKVWPYHDPSWMFLSGEMGSRTSEIQNITHSQIHTLRRQTPLHTTNEEKLVFYLSINVLGDHW